MKARRKEGARERQARRLTRGESRKGSRIPPDSSCSARAAMTVVLAERIPVRLAAIHLLVELGCVHDLVLRQADEDRLCVELDVANHAGREHHLLAEDPRAGVDDDVTV